MLACTALEGEFNYNSTLLILLGAKLIALNYPSIQESWAPYRFYRWAIGLALNHYYCILIYNPQTNRVCTADTFY